MSAVTDTIDVNFPPSQHPKMRKLIIRNTSTTVILAKIKLIGAQIYWASNLGALIPPGEIRYVMLVMLPKDNTKEFDSGVNPPLHVLLKENDKIEIHCRPLSITGTNDLVKKVHTKVQLQGKDQGLYRITYLLQPNAAELSKLSKQEQYAWWEDRINKYKSAYPERYQELCNWTESSDDHPETCAHTLRMITDAKRFSAPSLLVEIPGKVCLVESIPYPVANLDDSDCTTAHSISRGTSTCMPINEKRLLKLTPSDSDCGTARALKQTPCDWISSWINWFLPVKVAE